MSVLNGTQILSQLDLPQGQARCLPAVAYTDPAVLAQEIEQLFAAGWMSVGSVQQISEPGDIRPVVGAGQPLLLSRDQSGLVHVFHNVCRHRGLQLVDEPGCRRNNLVVCPYHQWSYRLDGELQATPYWERAADSQPDEETRAGLGLLPVRSAIWCDIIFVNLSGDAPAFEEFIAPLARRWQGLDLAQLRLAHTQGYQVPANWKFVCENFLDSYHVPWVHPQLGDAESAFNRSFNILSEDIWGFIMPEFDSARDDDHALPLFPVLPAEFRTALDLVYVFPNTLLLLAANWVQLISVQPSGPGLSHELLAAFLVGDAALGDAYAGDRGYFMQLLDEVNQQDIAILTRLQAARAGTATDQGRFTPVWDDLGVRFAKRVAKAYL